MNPSVKDNIRMMYIISTIVAIIDVVNIQCIESNVFAASLISNLGLKFCVFPFRDVYLMLIVSIAYEVLFIFMLLFFPLYDEYRCKLWFHIYRSIFNSFNIMLICCTCKEDVNDRHRQTQIFVINNIEPSITNRIYDIVEVQEDWECCICLLGENEENVFHLRCGHIVHEMCALQWFSQSLTCPLCRATI